MITEEMLDMLRNPDRIFRALLRLDSLPASERMITREIYKRFKDGRMTESHFRAVLWLAFQNGILSEDLRPYV